MADPAPPWNSRNKRSKGERRGGSRPGLRVLPLGLAFAGISGGALFGSVPADPVPAQPSPGITWTEPAQLGPNDYLPEEPLPTPVTPQETTHNTPASPPAPIAPEVDLGGSRRSLGRPQVAPIVRIVTSYDDNIFITPNHRKADLYASAVAGVAVGWGEFRDQLTQLGAFQETYEGLRTHDYDLRSFFFASYTPGYTAFLKNSQENSFDQDATLGGRLLFGNLVTDVRANYRLFSEALQDSGTRVRQSQFSLAVDSRYDLSTKTSLEADLGVTTHHYNQNGLVDSAEWIDRNYFNYQIMPKTQISAGATFGYVAVDSGPDQTYEQVLTRVNYDTGRALSGTLFGGVEFRQFSGHGTETEPVFGLEVVYKPVEGTTIHLLASRLVTNSAEYIGQNIVSTGFSLAVSQELWKKVTLTLRGGYANDEYGTEGGFGHVQRTDDGLQLGASIGFHLTEHLQVTLAYNYTHDDSSLERFTYDDNRATLDLDLLF